MQPLPLLALPTIVSEGLFIMAFCVLLAILCAFAILGDPHDDD